MEKEYQDASQREKTHIIVGGDSQKICEADHLGFRPRGKRKCWQSFKREIDQQ